MAHMVETMAFVGQTPWHGLGTECEESDQFDMKAFQVKSGLDWEAELVPLVTQDSLQLVDHRAVRRKTDGRVLGIVGDRYRVVQNSEAFDWFSPFLEAQEACLHTAGALCEGSRIWVLAKLNKDPMEIAPNDVVSKYLLLSHSHDGTLAVRVGFCPIRVLCANTMAMAHRDKASKLIRVKHTKDVLVNMENIRDTMNLANQEFEATAAQYRLLAKKDINQKDLEKYFKLVLDVKDEEKVSTRTKNMIGELTNYFEAGRGNTLPGVKGTYWAAYNAVTEWLSHERGRSQSSRLNALWYGVGATTNQSALDYALSMAV